MSERWVTFDCLGTLVDWHTGFSAVLTPIAGGRTPELVAAYHRHERAVEREPFRRYQAVLTEALRRAAREIGLPLSDLQAATLPGAWAGLRVFGDVEPMLARLRGSDLKLGVLTNCDEDLFRQTHQRFRQPFDLVITAEKVADYKPSLRHFQVFAQTTGVPFQGWVHVACSYYHDIVPAKHFGIRTVWLDRDQTGEDPAAASVRVQTAREAAAAVEGMLTAGA